MTKRKDQEPCCWFHPARKFNERPSVFSEYGRLAGGVYCAFNRFQSGAEGIVVRARRRGFGEEIAIADDFLYRVREIPGAEHSREG